MKRIEFLFIVLVLFSVKGFSQTEPKRELRSTWVASVANIDWPKSEHRNDAEAQKAELIRMLDLYKSINLNAIFLQVRTECDALYNSTYEPWSRYLTWAQGDDPGYDPLQFAIEEAHKRGIELHAWMNPYRINASTSDGGSYYHSTHIYAEHPEWAIEYSSGKKILNPGRPEVMSYIADVVSDLISNYSVDGIHFDDYFYSYDGTDASLDATEFAAYGGSMSLGDWRRDNVNRMVDSVNSAIQAINPAVRFGISPFGIYKPGVPSGISGFNAFSTIYCDPLAWLTDGSIDYLTPQLYWPTGGAQDFETLADWWSDQVFANDRHFYAGHGTYKFDVNPSPIAPSSVQLATSNNSKDLHELKAYIDKVPETADNYSNMELMSTSDPVADWTLSQIGLQIDIVRLNNDNNGLGNVFFSAKDFDRVNGLADYIANNKYTHPAIIPEMTWKASPTPSTPANLREETIETEIYLLWDYTGGTNDRFAVYTSEILTDPYEIIIEPTNLKKITFESQIAFADLSFSSNTTIVITAVSAYGVESEPVAYGTDYNYPEIISQTPADKDTIHRTESLIWDCDTVNAVFQLQISNNSSFSNPVVSSAWMDIKEISIANQALEGETEYFWRVRAKTDITGPYSATRSFVTGYPVIPEIVAPANLTQKISTNPKITWSASGNSDSVRVQISTESTFETLITEETFTSDQDFGVLTTKLEKETWYYLRIAALNKYGISEYTSFSTFQTTDGEIPNITVVGPKDAATVASFDNFDWETTTTQGTITYYLEIAVDDNFESIIESTNWISSTSAEITDMNLGGQRVYYWHVKAKSEYGESDYTSTRSFTTGYPRKPALSSPNNLSQNNDLKPAIAWTVDETTESVFVEISQSSDFTTIDNSETFDAANSGSILSTALNGGTDYYIHISAVNSYGNSIFSKTNTFKTGGSPSSISEETLNQESLTIFPNPYVQGLTKVGFVIENQQEVSIDIINSMGQTIESIVESQLAEQGYNEFNISTENELEPGIYYLRVKNTDASYYKAFVVTNQ